MRAINIPLINYAGPQGLSNRPQKRAHVRASAGRAPGPGGPSATLEQPPAAPGLWAEVSGVRLAAHQYRLHIYINRGLGGRPPRAPRAYEIKLGVVARKL